MPRFKPPTSWLGCESSTLTIQQQIHLFWFGLLVKKSSGWYLCSDCITFEATKLNSGKSLIVIYRLNPMRNVLIINIFKSVPLPSLRMLINWKNTKLAMCPDWAPAAMMKIEEWIGNTSPSGWEQIQLTL